MAKPTKPKVVVVTLDQNSKGFLLWVAQDPVKQFSKHGYLKAYDTILMLKRSFTALNLRLRLHDMTELQAPNWWQNNLENQCEE